MSHIHVQVNQQGARKESEWGLWTTQPKCLPSSTVNSREILLVKVVGVQLQGLDKDHRCIRAYAGTIIPTLSWCRIPIQYFQLFLREKPRSYNVGHACSRVGTTPAYQAAWPQARPDLEPISTDRCTPYNVEGQLQQGPLLAVGYNTGELELFR